jgi:hypothetical protein
MRKNTRDYPKKFEDNGAVDRLPDYYQSSNIEDRRQLPSPTFDAAPVRWKALANTVVRRGGGPRPKLESGLGYALGEGIGDEDIRSAQREATADKMIREQIETGFSKGGPVKKKRR